MPLDDLTLMFTLSLAAFCGAATVAISANMSKSVLGTRYWAIALTFLGLAFGSHLVISSGGTLRSLVYNLCLLAGHSFWIAGTWRYVGQKHSRKLLLMAFVSIALPIIYFSLLSPDREMRVLLIGFWLIAIRSANAAVLIVKTRYKENEYKAAWGFAVLALIEVLATLLYSYSTIFDDVPFIGQQSGTLAILTWLGALLGILSGVPLLMLLSSGRLISKLEETANYDLLTGLLNRRGFFTAADPLLAKCQRDKGRFSLMMVDVDHFKKVNDNYGHATGDAVLEIIGNCINGQFREEDIASRWGGEEICILLFNQSDDNLSGIAQRIRQCVSATSQDIPELKSPITLSIGISSSTKPDDDFDTIQRIADEALYQAKSAGRDRVEFA